MARRAPLTTDLLRAQVTRAIEHSTDLIADLKALAVAFEALQPQLAQATERERWREVARLTGLEETTPERLEALVEALADVLAGLTSADGGTAWLRRGHARLAAGEDVTAA